MRSRYNDLKVALTFAPDARGNRQLLSHHVQRPCYAAQQSVMSVIDHSMLARSGFAKRKQKCKSTQGQIRRRS